MRPGFRSNAGVGLIELLIAMTIFVVVLGIASSFLVQQSRATALSQATNDVEVTARTIAEAVVQDLQLSGSRATFAGGQVTYEPLNAACTESDRTGCIVARRIASDGSISDVPSGESPNGYSIWYRTSLTPAPEECRRIDYGTIGNDLYRSDVPCGSGIGTIDLDTALFGTGVQGFSVRFDCSDTSSSALPSDCYTADPDDYVQLAEVDIALQSAGRATVDAQLQMRAYTPNLRPSVNYGRAE